jgi:PAS domain S-box-containing protein
LDEQHQLGGVPPIKSTASDARILELQQAVAQLQQELAEVRTNCVSLEIEKAHFELFTDSIPDHAFVALGQDGCIVHWNRGAERLMGWRREDILNEPSSRFYTPEDVARGVPEWELAEAIKQGHILEERWHIRHDGSRFWCSGSLAAVRNEAGELLGFTKVMRDMTSHNHAQSLLRDSEERLRLFVENVTDYALFQVDTQARISGWNTGAERTFGYSETEILGQPMRKLYLEVDAERGDAERDLEIARDNGRFEDARLLVRKDGTRLFARWVTTPMRDDRGNLRGYAKVLRDETERRNAEQRLQSSLAEKHALLQEVHHRVKNNLQVITSLLSLQADRLENPEVSAAIEDTENRVRAIAALHETLYSSKDLASIEFGSYVDRLVRDLVGFFGADEQLKVTIQAQDLVVDISQAIPLGLIVNELVTNTLKHAFPVGRAGTVEIRLRHLPANSVEPHEVGSPTDDLGEITVKDNGVGLPPDLKLEETPSLGLHLVNVLVRQLEGKLEVAADEGTSFKVRFPLSSPSVGLRKHG